LFLDFLIFLLRGHVQILDLRVSGNSLVHVSFKAVSAFR